MTQKITFYSIILKIYRMCLFFLPTFLALARIDEFSHLGVSICSHIRKPKGSISLYFDLRIIFIELSELV